MSSPNVITGRIPPFAGGLARVGFTNAPIDMQGNFSVPINASPAVQVIILYPPAGTAYTPLSISATLQPGSTSITAQIDATLMVLGTFIGIPDNAVVGTDDQGYAVHGSSTSGVSSIVAGPNIAVDPSAGTGQVTVSSTASYPSVVGHAGQVLVTDGATVSWQPLDGGVY